MKKMYSKKRVDEIMAVVEKPLKEGMSKKKLAIILNARGLRTITGAKWTGSNLRCFLNSNAIRKPAEGKTEPPNAVAPKEEFSIGIIKGLITDTLLSDRQKVRMVGAYIGA